MKLDSRKQITETCCSLFCMLVQIYCAASYDIRCPSAVARLIRSSSQCRQQNNYTCLLDTVEEVYTESCNGPRPEMEGFKTTLNRNNFDRIRCSPMRYQPFTFMTTLTSDCVYQKSGCAEEGQRFYDPDDKSSFSDHKCVCDYTIGYAFVNKTRHGKCFCVPFEEDCSCYKMLCESNEQLTSEFECTRKFQYDQEMDRSSCLKIKPIQETSQGINGIHSINYITWNLNVKGYASAASGAVISILIIIIGILIILVFNDKLKEAIKQRTNKQKGQTNLKYLNQTDGELLSKSQNVPHELEQISHISGSSDSHCSEEKIHSNKEESIKVPYYTDKPAPPNIQKDTEIKALQNSKDIEEPDYEDELRVQPGVLNQKAELRVENTDTTVSNELYTVNQITVPNCSEDAGDKVFNYENTDTTDYNKRPTANQSTAPNCSEDAGDEALNHNKNKPESVDEQQEQTDDKNLVNSSQAGILSTVGYFTKQALNFLTWGGKGDEIQAINKASVEEGTKLPSQDKDSKYLTAKTEHMDTLKKTDIDSSVGDQNQSTNDNNANHISPDSCCKALNETKLNDEDNTSNHSNYSKESSSDYHRTETSENVLKGTHLNSNKNLTVQTEINKDMHDPKDVTSSSLND